MSRIIILRPQPGADATAERARMLGLEPVVLPLFSVEPLAWSPPEPARFNALMLTSANAARHAGPELSRYASLPLYVVGEATARACRECGLEPVAVGTSNAAALIAAIAQAGHTEVLHLCGEDVIETDNHGLAITRMPVYRAVESGDADALAALQSRDILLIHSPRAGKCLASLVPPEQRDRLSLIAISPAAMADAGAGWGAARCAAQPTDAAMLALAQELCHKPRDDARTRPKGSEMDSDIPTPERIAPLPAPAQSPRKSSARWTLVLLMAAFAGGVGITIWGAPAIKNWFGHRVISESETMLADPVDNGSMDMAAPASPQSVAALEARLAAVSAKLDGIASQANDAGGNAGRAEALLIAFAARRALDRGAPLGYLEGELRLRFADAQPRAVATIINAAASPVTIADLQTRLDELAPALTGAEDKADWWTAAKREMSSLIIVRKADAPSAEPQKVLERTDALLFSGRVDAAIREIERLPNRQKAEGWLQIARQYNEARRALDVIEAAAILEPKRLPPAQEAE